MELLDDADTIIVPAFRCAEEPAPAEVLVSLKSALHRGAQLVSFCSGAFVLAEAGVLDGRHATTHWKHAALFARR